MQVRDQLVTQALRPISDDNPAGASVRGDPSFVRVKEALREEEDLPQGDWDRPRKVADLPLAIQLAGEMLATRSKDLQVAAWLAEAIAKRDGIPGLRDGLSVVRGLIAQYWDGLYPSIEDGDVGRRVGALDYVARKCEPLVRAAPMNAARHTFQQYAESRMFGTEEQARTDATKERLRAEAKAKKKPLAEDIDAAVASTPREFYHELAEEVAACAAELDALDALVTAHCGDQAPSYHALRDALAEITPVTQRLLAIKGGPIVKGEPPPVTTPGGVTPATVPGANPTPDDPLASVVAAARALRRRVPTDPTPYLLLRALRWGELRAASAPGGGPEARVLDPPVTQARARLKALQLEARWAELLDAAEESMAAPEGRGWLDLQRYAATACDALGGDYARVGDAVRGAVHHLLNDFPALPETTLLDDTPAANAETLAWIDAEHLRRGSGNGAGADAAGASFTPGPLAFQRAVASAERPALDRAMAEVRSGHPERAIEMLMTELGRERSARGRLLRRVDVAAVMVEAGLEQIAEPILDEVVAEINERKLEGWEAGDVVARPLALLCRCLDRRMGDDSKRLDLYVRVCRLDPVAALAIVPAKAS